ncbi:MAG TPA: hypothetical protein VKX49_24450 [Bryobacteraceae bacterium]|nr:hypothetical protein [Bryobacteraceae bacterium]
MHSKKHRQFLTLGYQHLRDQINIRLPWPLAIHRPAGPERFWWLLPGQESAWEHGDQVWGVLFMGDEIRGFVVRARFYNDAIGPRNIGFALECEAVLMLARTNRVVQNVHDCQCVQRVFNEVLSLIEGERHKMHWQRRRRSGSLRW